MRDFEHLQEEPDLLLSYSRLSEFDRTGPSSLIKRAKIESDAVTLGSLVDDMISNEKIEEIYYVSDINTPTASLKKLVDIIIQNYAEIPSLEKVDEIVINNELWKSTKSLETRRKNYNNDLFWKYLDLHFNHFDKTIVTQDQMMVAEELVFVLQNYQYSKHYFEDNPNIDIIRQYKFRIVEDDYVMRGFYDMLIIDHVDKTIKVVDLKTGKSNLSQFRDSFINWRYYLQEAVYMDALKKLLQTELKEYAHYKVLDFEFLYIGTREKIPAVFKVSDFWHTAAKEGFYLANGTYHKGMNQLIKEVIYHWNTNQFDLPMEFYKNDGVMYISNNGVTKVE